MFFKLFSDHEYRMEDWQNAFRVENLTHASVREYWRDFSGRSKEQLVADVQARVRDLDARMGQSTMLNDLFITDFLEREVDQIARLVADLESNPTMERETLGARFVLNGEKLQECMGKSLEFKNFINKAK